MSFFNFEDDNEYDQCWSHAVQGGDGRDKYYGIFSGVKYAERVAKFTAKSTGKSTAKEIARELEKMLVEKASKKKIAEFIKRLKKEE